MLKIQERLSKSFYVLLSLPSTAMGFALSIQISALSWILTTRFGLDIHEVGLVWAAGPLAGIFGQVIIGLVSDNVWFWGGRRRPFILIGGTMAALMLLALPNIGRIGETLGVVNLLIVATAVALSLDLAINVSFNPTRSLVADVTPEGNARTRGYTWMQTISGFFGVLAYVIGAAFGNEILIVVGVAVVLLFSCIPALLVREPRSIASAANPGTSSAHQTNWRQFWQICIAHGFSWIGVQTMFVYIIAFIQQKMFAPSLSPAVIAEESGTIIAVSFAVLNTVGFILPAFVLDPLAERWGRVRVHAASAAIMAVGYAGIVLFGHSPFALYALMAVTGIGWASIVSLPFAIMSEAVDQRRMGFFMGMFNLSVVLPQLFVSLVVGSIVLRSADKNVIFIISAAALFASAALWSFVREHRAVPLPDAGGTRAEQ